MKKVLSIVLCLMLVMSVMSMLSFSTFAAVSLKGSGTAASPYLINNEDDYEEFVEDFPRDGYSGKYFKLTADITTDEETAGSESKKFKGVFDGNKKTITFTDDEFEGMFAAVQNAIITDVNVKASIDVADEMIGAVAGISKGGVTFQNCTFTGTLKNTNNVSAYTGGICGYASGETTFLNCVNNAEINCAGSYIGGILGKADGAYVKFVDCKNYGKITADVFASGIVGCVEESEFFANHCENGGEITANGCAAGIANFANKTSTKETKIQNCINRGNLTATLTNSNGRAAGICACSDTTAGDLTILNCANYGNTSANECGGILAYWSSMARMLTVKNCYNAGTHTGTAYGAFIGYYDNGSKDVMENNFYNSDKCAVTDQKGKIKTDTATAVSGADADKTAGDGLNAKIQDGSDLLKWTVLFADATGKTVSESASGLAVNKQAAFAMDLTDDTLEQIDIYEGADSELTGSLLSEGNLWIIIVIAVVVIGAIAVLVAVKKKKTATEGGNQD